MIVAERRAHSTQNALEEARTLLDQADRARRHIEQELADSNESLSDQTVQNQALEAAKRKIEGEIMSLNVRKFTVSQLNLFSLLFVRSVTYPRKYDHIF